MKALIDTDNTILGLFPHPEIIPDGLLEKYALVEVEICPICHGGRYVVMEEVAFDKRAGRNAQEAI